MKGAPLAVIEKGVVLSLGGSTYDPTDAVGRLLFHVLGMVAEFAADLIRMQTREGMTVAKANGRLKGPGGVGWPLPGVTNRDLSGAGT